MWALVIAGVGAGSSFFNAVDEATSNRAIRDKLDKVVIYLQDLDRKLELIQAQNREILQRLDELPKIIRAIVQEIVDIALLEERYSALHAIKLNITELKLDKNYRITERGWEDFSKVLTYLFRHENRVSYLFKLILACELALAATRNQARPFVEVLLKEKIALLIALRDDYVSRISVELNALKGLLDNAQYIQGHNLSEKLEKFEDLHFTTQPDRLRVITYTDRECRTKVGPRPEYTEYEVCRDVQRTREEPDTPFHTARDSHADLIRQRAAVIGDMLKQLANVSSVIEQLVRYLRRIGTLANSNENFFLFHVVKGNSNSPAGATPFSEEELVAYQHYYDDLLDKPDNPVRVAANIFDVVIRPGAST